MGHRLLTWSLWPLCFTVQTSVVVVAGWSDPYSLVRAMGLTSIALILVLVWLEQVLPYRPDWSIRGDREIWRDIGHGVLYTYIGGTVAQIVFLYAFASVLSQIGLASGLGIWPVNSPLVVQVLTVVLLGDMLEYWYHRLLHTVPWLWPLHAVHHTPVRLNTLKGARHHLFYFLGRGLIVWVPLLLVGVPPGLVVWQFVAVVLTGVPSHANIALRTPAFFHLIFVTPEFHRIHHSIDAKQSNSNYSPVFPIWDMIFGTHTDPMLAEAREMGIGQDPIPRKFLSELLSTGNILSPRPEWTAYDLTIGCTGFSSRKLSIEKDSYGDSITPMAVFEVPCKLSTSNKLFRAKANRRERLYGKDNSPS